MSQNHEKNGKDGLDVALEHGRALFIYHAGQRHGSLNFYFAVLGIFVAGYVSLFTSDKLWATPGFTAPIIGTIVGGAALAVTVLFGTLDRRNADLVEWDEKLVDSVEKKLAGKLSLSEMKIFEQSEGSPVVFRRRSTGTTTIGL